MLAKVVRARAAGIYACQASERINVAITRHVQEEWCRQLRELPANLPVALLTDLDPGADGCLVWEPGQTEPAAITPPGSRGSRLGRCFVLFVPEQTVDGGGLLEDGFAMSLTAPSWEAVRSALIDGQAISIPATNGGLALSVGIQDRRC